MVGVPRSKGCSTCRSRRIKCDEARPECGQCQRYGCPCPGYNRGLKFQDEGPNLQRRHRRVSDRKLISVSHTHDAEKKNTAAGTSSSSSSSSAIAVKDSRTEMPEELGREALLRLLRAHATEFDEKLSPSLIQKLFVNQQPRLFMDFTCAAFPTLYFHNRFRSHTAFPEWMVKEFSSNAYQDSAVCCLSAVYLATITKDSRIMRTSWHLYGDALRRVNRIINTDEGLSDNVLSTVIMLTLYEIYARTTPDAWVKHARGVREIFIKRGVERHTSGLGRSCYYAFRGIIVAHALYDGIPCFLDEEEWQNFAIKVQKEDAKKPSEWSVFVHISEMVFMEMVKCPRYIYDIRRLSSSVVSTPEAELSRHAEISALAARIRTTCANIRNLKEELLASIMYHFQKRQGIEVNEDGSFVGPAPAFFPDTNPTLLLQGATQCVNILEKVLRTIKVGHTLIKDVSEEEPTLPEAAPLSSPMVSPPSPPSLPSSHSRSTDTDSSDYISPTPSADSMCETISTASSSPPVGDSSHITSSDPNKPSTAATTTTTFTLPFRLVSELSKNPAHDSSGHGQGHQRPVVWLDHIACSMGMIGADIEVVVEEEEEEGEKDHGMFGVALGILEEE